MKWPALGLAFVLFHLLAATAYCGAAFPTLETPRISSLFQLATSAPGLSAMVFVKEFVGDEAAGKAALFDLPTKLYLIFALPKLLEAFGRTEVSRVRKQQSLAGIAKDPLNVAIVAGIIMAATGTPFSSLSFVGRGAAALATCQTPVLFVLIGMKINFSGATPAVSLALLSLRHAASYIFFVIATTLLESSADGQRDDLLTLLLLCQAAVSVIGWSQMNKAKDAGVKGYDTAFAFDIVGFSMPVTMILQTTACLLDRSTALDTVSIQLFSLSFEFFRTVISADSILRRTCALRRRHIRHILPTPNLTERRCTVGRAERELNLIFSSLTAHGRTDVLDSRYAFLKCDLWGCVVVVPLRGCVA